mgnify:CR=1 FL=1
MLEPDKPFARTISEEKWIAKRPETEPPIWPLPVELHRLCSEHSAFEAGELGEAVEEVAGRYVLIEGIAREVLGDLGAAGYPDPLPGPTERRERMVSRRGR